jgi:hypothetical protein
MGYYVIKDIGANEIIIDNTEYGYDEIETPQNPSAGYVNLKPFSISIGREVEINVEKNITNYRPRISVGNKQAIPIEISTSFSRQISGLDSEEEASPTDIIDACLYLEKWIDSGTIKLLYFMPNNDTDIVDNNCVDFYSSLFRILATNHWSNTTIPKSVNGYTGTSDYDAIALPIYISNLVMKEQADTKKVEVSITAYMVSPEA